MPIETRINAEQLIFKTQINTLEAILRSLYLCNDLDHAKATVALVLFKTKEASIK